MTMRNSKINFQNDGSHFPPDSRLFTPISGKAGFTLLELMISIAIIGLIVLIITGALRLGFRSVDAGEAKIESLERIRASLTIMDSQIQSQIPITYNDNGSKKYYFKGERTSMQFSTNYSLWNGQAGYVLLAYKVVPDLSGRQALWISENVIGMGNVREAKLFDALSEIYFEYFYKDPTEEQGNWINQWSDETVMPEKVRVHLVEGVRRISLVIPMRARGTLAQQPSAGVSRSRGF